VIPLNAEQARARVLRWAMARVTSAEQPTDASDHYASEAIAIARGSGARAIVLGHTHGARDLSVDGVRYLNTGTWINLMSLDQAVTAAASNDDPWPAVASLLDPASFRSTPRLSYVEMAGEHLALQEWAAA
jgi:hypothetical protein